MNSTDVKGLNVRDRNMKLDELVNGYVPPKPKPKPPRPPVTTNMKMTGFKTIQPVVRPEYKSTYNTGDIKKVWDEKTAADIGMLDANLESETGQLDSQRSVASNDYRSLRNQSSANYAMQKRAQEERMANMGVSAGGGTSRSYQQSATNNLNNQLGSIKLQERQYNEEVDRALRDLKSKYGAEKVSTMANNNLQSTSQSIQSDQWLEGHKLAAEQFNTSTGQWNQQFVMQQENAKVTQLIDLLKAKKISRKQFEELSGIKLR